MQVEGPTGMSRSSAKSGKRTIVEGEAEIVRRIFEEYVAGRTPREIAHDLNKETGLTSARALMECLHYQWQL